MLNAIKMELFRLRKSLTFYIVILILFITTLMIEINLFGNMHIITHKSEFTQSQIYFAMKNISSLIKNKVTLMDIVPYIFSTVYLMITGIFITFFIGSENDSGFIKNIIGCVEKKWYIIVAKVITMSLFILFEMLIQLLLLGISFLIGWKNFSLGISTELLQYLGLLYLLYVAFAAFTIMVAFILKNTAINIIVIVLEAFSVFAVIIERISPVKGISKYFISMNIASLKAKATPEESIRIIFISIIAIILYSIISCITIEKRDIK